ncbi:MAG: substrate-binding periplasmic protein, partial [Dongiaceae bacterium]
MISLLTAIVVVIIMLRFYGPSSSAPALETKKAESTFERITRTGVIRCGYGTWPPYLMKDPNTGQLSGMNYEVMEAIGRNLELKIEWTEEVGWGNYIEGINTKRYDMFCASVWPNGPRTKNTTLTKPTFYSAAYALARIDDHRFDGDLSKVNDPAVKISVIEGDYTESLAKEDYPKASRNVLSPNSDGAQVLLE